MSDCDVGPAVMSPPTHTNTHTCTTREPWKRGAPVFSLRWHFIFKHTQKLSSLAHISSILESQQCTLSRSPLEGNIPLVEKAAISNATVLRSSSERFVFLTPLAIRSGFDIFLPLPFCEKKGKKMQSTQTYCSAKTDQMILLFLYIMEFVQSLPLTKENQAKDYKNFHKNNLADH